MRTARSRAVVGRLLVRQVLSVRTATGVQHQAASDRRGRFTQAEPDILAAQHIHGTFDYIFLEQQPDGRKPEELP